MGFIKNTVHLFIELAISKKLNRANQIEKQQQEYLQMKYEEYSSLILNTFRNNNKSFYYLDKVPSDKAIAYCLFYYPDTSRLYVAMHNDDGNGRDIVKKVFICQEGRLYLVAELEIFSLFLLCDIDIMNDAHEKEDALKECNYFDIKEFKWIMPNKKPNFATDCIIYNIFFSSLL